MVAGVSKLARFPVALPTAPLPENVDPQAVASLFKDLFNRVANQENFVADAVWRDTFALTGTLRTFYSAEGIVKAWAETTKASGTPIANSLEWKLDAARVTQLPSGASWVDIVGGFRAKTRAGLEERCTVMASVVPRGDSWAIWTLRTILDDIEGWPSVNSYEPSINRYMNGKSDPQDEIRFDCVVVGGGQAGLSVAARLQALDVNYVIIDKYKKIGDSWAVRYDSARLHTIREYSHLPFDRTFPKDKYQEFLTKDDLAHGYFDWAHKFGIDKHVWVETELLKGSWSDLKQEWSILVRKAGKEQTIKSRFIVLATGGGGQIPKMPDLAGREKFRGEVLHSQRYVNSKSWAGKRGIVVGTANTAHDVADDMFEAGLASTTMIQRSTTYVLPYEYWQKISSRTYNEGFPTDLADTLQMTGPNAVGRLMAKAGLDAMASADHERFEALARAGFLTESQGDIMFHLFEAGGGHYMDVGTSKKISDGKIKIKSNSAATHYTPEGLGFADGDVIPADVIVWATGFETNLRDLVRRTFGDDTAERMDDFFNIDDEGEIRGAWRIQHPGLLTHGMALGQARFMSKYIALQIKAVLEGKPFTTYSATPVPPLKS